MSYGRTCLAGVHVSGWHILQDAVPYWRICPTGGQVLLEGLTYRKACLTGGHVLQEYMFYRSNVL